LGGAVAITTPLTLTSCKDKDSAVQIVNNDWKQDAEANSYTEGGTFTFDDAGTTEIDFINIKNPDYSKVTITCVGWTSESGSTILDTPAPTITQQTNETTTDGNKIVTYWNVVCNVSYEQHTTFTGKFTFLIQYPNLLNQTYGDFSVTLTDAE
jgi:ribosomal protein L31